MFTPLECALLQEDSIPWITSGDDTQYKIYNKEGEVVICFAPSNSQSDWKNNFRFWKKPYKNMEIIFRVHSGYLKCWKLIRDEIEAKVLSLNPTSVQVTGWSYGGALAVLCMEDMKFILPNTPRQLVTFGAPRVIGNWNWGKIKDRWEGSLQFKNGSDFVTCIPFPPLFRHVRPLINLNSKVRLFRYFKTGKYHLISDYIKSLTLISQGK